MKELVDAYFKEHSLIEHQIESFNDFIENRLQRIVDNVGIIETDVSEYKIKLGKIRVGKPTIKEVDGSIRNITPMEARIRDLTYAAPIYLEMTAFYEENNEIIEVDSIEAYIGELPIMLGSKYCILHNLTDEEKIKLGEDPKDPLGYFIINGTERVLITQEDLIPNRIITEFTEKNNKKIALAKVFSTRHGFRALCSVEKHPNGLLYVNAPNLQQILLVIILRALGAETDKDIIESINDPRFVMELLLNIQEIREEYNINTKEEALEFIGKKLAPGQSKEYRIKRAKSVIQNQLLPHLGVY